MRLLSQIFQPILTIPKNAKIKNTEITCKSQKLLLECGLIRPTSSGLFSLLPLARRVLDKLEALARECVEAAGGQRVSMPALTAESLWEKSGRLEDVGTELMGVKDRHGKRYLLAPTHEEAVADLLADVGPLSYKQLPLILYQISNKYRDELRPKHGILRAREFRMLDAYSAHPHEECANTSYERISRAYTSLFRTLDLPVYRVKAPSGDMGGSLSHEWQLCADAGEDAVDVCLSCSHATLAGTTDRDSCEKCGGPLRNNNSIEVGHTFVLGTRYSAPLSAQVVPASGAPHPVHMACYGIGITRLMAAGVEALSSETSIRWPRCIAPYSAIIIGPKEGSKEWSAHGWDSIQRLYEHLSPRDGAHDVLVDDRHHLTIGKRLLMADRIGYPTIIVCGRSILESTPKYEIHRCLTNKESAPQLMTLDELIEYFQSTDVQTDKIKDIK